MLDDICKLLTGTPVASLSASCDKVNSSVLANSLSNNWTVFDAAASASAQVLRSLNADGTSYKFAHLSFSGSTLYLTSHESWNAGTHVGTNQACFYTNAGFSIPASTVFTAASGGTLYLYATNNIAVIAASDTLGPFVAEFNRDCPAIDNTYPCHTLGGVALCRVKYATSVGDFKVGSTPAFTTGASASTDIIVDNVFRKPTGEIVYSAVPLSQSAAMGVANSFLVLGEIQGLLFMGYIPAANFLDEIDIDGVRHVFIVTSALTGNTYGWLVPKG